VTAYRVFDALFSAVPRSQSEVITEEGRAELLRLATAIVNDEASEDDWLRFETLRLLAEASEDEPSP
jgi:hypothetical protein